MRTTDRLASYTLTSSLVLLGLLVLLAPPARAADAKETEAVAGAAAEAAPEKPAIVLNPTPPPPDLDWKKGKGTYLADSLPLLEAFEPAEIGPHPVILILVDALRPDHLSFHGYPRETSPNLDAFARDGLSFDRFYVAAPWTRPSTTSILTGLTPTRHRTQCEGIRLSPAFETLPEALNKLGYKTAGVVGNGNGAGIAGLDQGFKHYQDTKFFKGLPTADMVFDEVGAWLDANKKLKKSFMFTFVVDPHDPYHGPSPEAEARWLWEGHPEILRVPRWEYPKGKDPTPDQRRAMIAVYDSAVRYTDEALGRLFARLKKNGLWDRATIIVTADHGDGFGEHRFYKHAHHFWEEVVRVPMIIRSPKIPAASRGRRVDTLASSVDIWPTIVQIAGGKPDAYARPGASLFDVAAGKIDPASRRIFSEYNCFGISRQMMVAGKYKVVLQQPADEEEFMRTVTRKDLLPSVIFDREELQAWDLEADPLEEKNLVPGTDPAKAPPEIKALLQEMRKYIETQPGGPAMQAGEMDEATEANLRALGYIQ
ncbi:MAG: sulfatase [Deltaproteobacteria bacterium]|nr:sulfatase [Deltaproteobacteria bacterium]